jgi:predicted Zn-ribbon and HTH transcriptional regulator
MSGHCYDVDAEIVDDPTRQLAELDVDDHLKAALEAAESPAVREQIRRAMQTRVIERGRSRGGVRMSAPDAAPPIDMDFDPVEDLSGAALVKQKRELAQVLYNGYTPHLNDWHEDIHIRHSKLWREMRRRAEMEPPECPDCGGRRWRQSPGDPVYCSQCGRETVAEMEEAVHEAWDAIIEEIGAETPTGQGTDTDRSGGESGR